MTNARPLLAPLLALALALPHAHAALPTGFEQTVNDPGAFLENLNAREPDSQKLIYTLLWPVPVETVIEWAQAGYEVRMLIPEATPPQILDLLEQNGIAYRLLPAEPAPLPQTAVAAAAVRTALIYEPPSRWRIVSNAGYAGLFANLAYLWENFGAQPTRTAP